MPLFIPFIPIIGAGVVSTSLVYGMRRLAVLDHPNHRSAHSAPIPKGGGIGIMLSFMLFYPFFGTLFRGYGWATLCVACALGLLCGVSWLDDLYQYSPLVKLAAQCCAAVFVVCAGCLLVPLSPFLMIVAGVWLVFCMNAVNFMDGLNGLIAGCLFTGSVFLACCASFLGIVEIRGVALLFAASLAGFLPFNFPQARIFMGDVGSQGCGLLAGIAALFVAHFTSPNTPSGCLMGFALLFPLLYDVSLTLIRRAWRKQRLTQAHREHFYQIFHQNGVAAPLITLGEIALTLWSGSIALAVARLPLHQGAPLLVVLLLLPQGLWSAWAFLRCSRSVKQA
ncbi:MAG: UDP-phosphate alpha-N-acetylglucosaminephosphotransferase [Acetobacter sp.]|nr:UDP-phosphate alpha-N-acetylglucosaminephosphotransferase [Acetobacter sp.]